MRLYWEGGGGEEEGEGHGEGELIGELSGLFGSALGSGRVILGYDRSLIIRF